MTAARGGWPADILHFWFHVLRPEQWFGRSDAVDAALARRYGRWLRVLRACCPEVFVKDRRVARAAILLFDQVSRNTLRQNRQAFAADPLARAICKRALACGWDRGLSKAERQFLLMPLMHSESIADQRQSVRLFTRLGDPAITGFARDHWRMVARFGRFPHRNPVLGRRSTPAEERAVAAGHAW